jgi:hypothetical protein
MGTTTSWARGATTTSQALEAPTTSWVEEAATSCREVCFRGDGEFGTFEILIGGDGNDFLWVRDTPFQAPRKDLVLCGDGRDGASVDRVDVVVGCERLMFRHPTHEEHLRILAKRGLEGRV